MNYVNPMCQAFEDTSLEEEIAQALEARVIGNNREEGNTYDI